MSGLSALLDFVNDLGRVARVVITEQELEQEPLPVHVSVSGAEILPDAVAGTAYYIVAETLTNAVKHARASAAHVCLERLDESVRVEVGDDGVGGATISAGSELCGLADRVQALRGTLAIVSPRGGGTTITASIPVAAPVALASTTASS